MNLKTEQNELQRTYRLHLNRLHDSKRDKEIALMMGEGVGKADLVRKMRAGDAKIHTCRMIRLSKSLVQEDGDTSLLQELVPEGYIALAVKAGDTNGSILDELRDLMELNGKIAKETSKEQPDRQKLTNLTNKLNTALATLMEELK